METKRCPYCAEEILAEAIKCKHCREFLNKHDEGKLQVTETCNPESLDGMAFVKGGTFQMGDEVGDLFVGDKPVHNVELDNFYIDINLVTEGEFEDIMGIKIKPEFCRGRNHSHNTVHWYAALIYCNKKSIREGLIPCYSINQSNNPDHWGAIPSYSNSNSNSAIWDKVTCNWSTNGYRLPTEAEWEYAARGGIHHKDFYLYSGSNVIGEVAWYSQNSDGNSHPVATKSPNQLGIYDMSGNSCEWCWDWFEPYTNDLQTNPKGPLSGVSRVFRGGALTISGHDSRVAYRGREEPTYCARGFGFRIVRSKI
ncbi:MAG: SUMF1/EgtB/PvdO family nonheme iron enzyme [Candidatus Delongbacteria bacterium]|jgi:sulfatase modifying factor 1|nr:SUMF1/EgtB/PvdO family nonheme iron enzyme [Candidatus Delongbacteria bacterium]